MKILYISKSVIPSRTANSIQVMKMCQAFSDNGHEVVLLAPDLKTQYEKNVDNIYKYYGVRKNFEVKKLWHPDIRSGALLYTLAIFFYLIFKKKYNLVYGRFLHGCYVAVLLKNKVIFESHERIFDNKNHRIIVFKKLIRNKYFKKLIVISNALKNMYLKKGFLNENKIQVAHDGADNVVDLNYKIKLLGSNKNLKVGYVGHLYKGKGMEVISLMANKLDKDIEIHIIGGLEKDIKLWKKKIISKNVYFYGFVPHKEVSKYINAFDVCLLPNQKIISKNVYFYGFVPHKEVSKYINAFDVCLLPNQKIIFPYSFDSSKKNGVNISTFTSPLKLFEYMSHKKAIIASDLTVIREVLNRKNSILVKYNDIKSWISSIKKLKKLKNRKLIANQALKDFYNYSWKNRASKLLNNIDQNIQI